MPFTIDACFLIFEVQGRLAGEVFFEDPCWRDTYERLPRHAAISFILRRRVLGEDEDERRRLLAHAETHARGPRQAGSLRLVSGDEEEPVAVQAERHERLVVLRNSVSPVVQAPPRRKLRHSSGVLPHGSCPFRRRPETPETVLDHL